MQSQWERFQAWWAQASTSVSFHRRAKWLWVVLIPVSYLLRESVAWVSFMSHYAIVTGHWSSEEAAMGAVMPDGRDMAEAISEIEQQLAEVKGLLLSLVDQRAGERSLFADEHRPEHRDAGPGGHL